MTPADHAGGRPPETMEIVRNLTRRKLRSTLTIAGIVIGIFALTTMGALAEHFNALIAGGVTYYGSAVQVGGDSNTQGILPLAKQQEIEKVQGVRAVFPQVSVPAKPGQSGASFGVPDTVVNSSPEETKYSPLKTSYASGHDLTAGTRGQVVLGATIASELKAGVGDTVHLPVKPPNAGPGFQSHAFQVVGVLNKTETAPDNLASVSLPDAQMLFKESLPAAVRSSVDANQLVSGFTVYGPPGAGMQQLDQLASRINGQVGGVKAARPTDLVNAFKSGSVIFTAITTGAAVLALVIGGLSVVNTMIMAVTERVREIGLKKAVGARTGHIVREYLLEAGLIGLLGGSLGYLLGVGLTNLINVLGRSQNLELFLITPALTVVALGFATALGVVAGVIPALRAARMDPVTALRTTN